MKVRTFRDLVVWQRGMDLARTTYEATERMPKAEMFGLTSQMRRAACSIPMNVAEGFGKHSRPEFIRGLRIATGSLLELMTAYELATTLGHVETSPRMIDLLAEEDRLLSALIRKPEAKKGYVKRRACRLRLCHFATLPLCHSRLTRSISIVSRSRTRPSLNFSAAARRQASSSLNPAACGDCLSR